MNTKNNLLPIIRGILFAFVVGVMNIANAENWEDVWGDYIHGEYDYNGHTWHYTGRTDNPPVTVWITDVTPNIGDFVIPSTLAGRKVTSIASLWIKGKVTIPSHIKYIEYCAFNWCSELLEVTMEEGVEYIGSGAFSHCIGLKSIEIPSTVSEAGSDAFYGCSGLTNLTIKSQAIINDLSSAFLQCSNLVVVTTPYRDDRNLSVMFPDAYQGIEDLTLVGDFKSIPGHCFNGCNSLKKIVLPDCVSAISTNAFSGCSNIVDVTMPWIPDMKLSQLFPDSYGKIKTITLTGSIEHIPAEAFKGCENLEIVDIPRAIKWVGASAFEGCEHLTLTKLPDGVGEIGASAFKGCKALKEPVELPNSVTNIGASAFADCTGIESVGWSWWPWRIEEIPSSLFKGCTSLTRVDGISSNIGRIGASAFEDCESLSSILLPSSVTNMGVKVFQGCSNLTSAQLPSNLKTIPDYTFNGCGKLQSVTMPSKPSSIGKAAFFGCLRKSEITIPETVTKIGEQAFGNCWALRSLDIPEAVTTLPAWMCEGCIGLSRIAIPPGVEKVSEQAFIGCTNLTSVVLPGSVTSIGTNAFARCLNLKTILLDDRANAVAVVGNSIPAATIVNVLPRSGYSFMGWTDESDAPLDDPFHMGQDITAFPTWRAGGGGDEPVTPDPIVWSVTFNKNADDAQGAAKAKQIEDGSVIGELPTLTRDGYTFAGWWTAANGGVEVTSGTIVTANMTVYAHWTENAPPEPSYTSTTPVPVRHDWLAKYPTILNAADSNYETAAMRETGKRDGKGNALCVWHDYVSGTDPTDVSSVFRAKVEFENGTPKVGWEPDLNDGGTKSERFYKVFGKKTLAANENWTRIADETAQKDYNFFKVTVNMEETPDTEEELKFGDGSGTDGDSVIDDERPATLAAPANFNASSVYRGFGIYLSWNAVDGAEEYAVYRSDSANFSGALKVASIVSPQNWYSDEELEDFDTHYYWVRAENPTAVSSLSDCKSAAAATLGGPKNLTATEDRNDGVLLSWSAAIGATSYRVYYSNNIYAGQYVGSMTLLGETDGLEFLDTTIAAGEVRMYKILSLGERSDDWGSCSAVAGARASGSPQAPSVQISSSSYSVYLYWGPVAGATGYEVYRGTANNSSTAEKIAVVMSEGLSTSYSNLDTPPVAGKNYYYWVRTVYADKTSGFSVAVTGGLKVQMPTGIVVSTDKSDGVLVSWNAVEGATSYIVYGKRAGIDSDYVELGSTDATTWLDTTVSQGKFSRYGVAAVSETGTTSIGDASEYGYRAKKVVSVVLTGTDEATIDPYSGATLNFKCTATYADGTTEDVAADIWDYSEFAGEMWMSEQTFYVRLGNTYLEGELTSKQLTMRASYTANAGDANPTVYNLLHKVVVHPAE